MQRIDIQIEEFAVAEWINGRGNAAVFYIDRMPITRFLGQFHPALLHSRYSDSPYGRWIGIHPGDVLPPSKSFLGTPDTTFSDCDGRLPISACSECGEYWCDGIWTRIIIREDTASWTDFIVNPELNPVVLEQVPPLIFDVEQYRAAFTKVRLRSGLGGLHR
jgi:hypothetical protein